MPRILPLKLGHVLLPVFVAFAVSVSAVEPRANAQQDERELIDVAPNIRDQFLAKMRQDLVNLNDVIAAIAEKNFEEAARIAERRIGLAHMRIMRMEQAGASDEEIAAAIADIRAMVEKHGADLPNVMRRGGMGGGGVGRFMPEELRVLGQAFHQTAYPLAAAARAVAAEPSAENYQRLFSALSDMTASCLGCHEVYRVK